MKDRDYMHRRDYMYEQLSAGILQIKTESPIKTVWHTDSFGNYWMGNTYHRTPEQLFQECATTIAALINNHPELVSPGEKK